MFIFIFEELPQAQRDAQVINCVFLLLFYNHFILNQSLCSHKTEKEEEEWENHFSQPGSVTDVTFITCIAFMLCLLEDEAGAAGRWSDLD